MRRSGLSIERRLYIFAAGEEQTIHARENGFNGIVTGKRRNDEWYQSCTFECSDVCAVESHTMKLAVTCIGSRGNGDDRGSPGRSN